MGLINLCQTKGCASYGKSIPRDKLEGEVGDLIRTLEPSQELFDAAKLMFKNAWATRATQVEESASALKQQIAQTDKQIETLLERFMAATSDVVFQTYEKKVNEIEKSKAKLVAMSTNRPQNQDTFDGLPELALQFLANPWKLWKSGQITLRRTVLKLDFAGPLSYCRSERHRTLNLAWSLKALGTTLGDEFVNGAVRED